MALRRSSIKLKKKPCKGCGKDCFIFSHGMCKYCASKRLKTKPVITEFKSIRGVSNKKMDKADTLFSLLVRILAADSRGNVSCYTCGKTTLYKHMQCGHFIRRGNLVTRWMLENSKPQCKNCNEMLSGNMKVYEKRLEFDFPGLPERLKGLGNMILDKTTFDIDDLIETLKTKLKEAGYEG